MASVTVMRRDHVLSSFLFLCQQADRKFGLHQVLVKSIEQFRHICDVLSKVQKGNNLCIVPIPHIDVKLSCSKTDHYCPDGSIEIALQTFVREKRYFCNCLALRSCSWAIAALESHLSFIFAVDCKKNMFKVLKVLLPIRPEGII